MKFGVFLYQPEPVEGVDYNFYRQKSESGIVGKPNLKMYTNIAVFGDNNMAAKRPDWVSVSSYGPALRTNKRFNLRWDVVCMTNPEAREYNLKIIAETAKVTPGISISSQHFADQHFCTCPRCIEQQRKSGLKWIDWRATTITEFLREAKNHAKGTFAVEMFPDPLMAKERFGIDFDAISELVDYFHVPLSARDYTTNYWVDLLARDFIKILNKPVVVELSGEMQTVEKTDALLKTVALLGRHGLMGTLLLVHDSDNAEQIARYAVHNSEFRDWLSKNDFSEMKRIVDDWAKLY